MRWFLVVAVVAGCGSDKDRPEPGELSRAVREDTPPTPPPPPEPIDPYQRERERMVEDTIVGRGISDSRVVSAMMRVPRHRFVPPDIRAQAYDDRALPIGFNLTISQPYIVATMTEAAKVKPGHKVLEIGTGSGYQAAVLHEIGAKVYTIEIVDELAERTQKLLGKLGLDAIQLKVADGFYGWPDAAPFDAILVTAAAPTVPQRLLDQLAVGGRMVIPLGDDGEQRLTVLTKRADGTTDDQVLFEVMFGPMIGEIRGEP